MYIYIYIYVYNIYIHTQSHIYGACTSNCMRKIRISGLFWPGVYTYTQIVTKYYIYI